MLPGSPRLGPEEPPVDEALGLVDDQAAAGNWRGSLQRGVARPCPWRWIRTGHLAGYFSVRPAGSTYFHAKAGRRRAWIDTIMATGQSNAQSPAAYLPDSDEQLARAGLGNTTLHSDAETCMVAYRISEHLAGHERQS